MTTSSRLPTVYIAHGGGPCFFMDGPPGMETLWDPMGNYLKSIPEAVGVRPKALLVISAHWECPKPTVLIASTHSLYYDYYGFPEHTYRLQYPAKGSRDVATRVQALLEAAGHETEVETKRGLDHGVFIPLMLMYPDADIPVIQLSMQQGLDPAQHLKIGHALAPLRDEGVLIVGSGLSYHNLRLFFSPNNQPSNLASAHFNEWLNRAATAAPAEREAMLTAWASAPNARDCHPREEHLLPLMVAAGAGDKDAGTVAYNERLMGKMVSGFQFGAGASTVPASPKT